MVLTADEESANSTEQAASAEATDAASAPAANVDSDIQSRDQGGRSLLQTAALARSTLKGNLGADIAFDEDGVMGQEAPKVEAGSEEEAALLREMQALLSDDLRSTVDAVEQLMCLRGRKYDAARAAELLPRLVQLKQELKIGEGSTQLTEDVATGKVMLLGKASTGHAILWVRLARHSPKRSAPFDLARLVTTLVLRALSSDAEAQRSGLCVLMDQRGMGLKNLDMRVPKLLMGSVLPRLPVRVARLVIFKPPMLVGKLLLPVVLSLMSKKLTSRIVIINSGKDEISKLHTIFPKQALPHDLGGTFNEIFPTHPY